MQKATVIASPSQLEKMEPATMAGFSFLVSYGDKMGTNKKYVHYKPPKLHKTGKWFVFFSYRNPETGLFERFKVYEGINSIKDIGERVEFGKLLIHSVEAALSDGFNPFEVNKLKVESRTWSLIQGINYFKQNLHSRGLRKRTIQTYESVIRMMYDAFKPLLLQDIIKITKQDITNCLKNISNEKKWSNSTFNNNLTLTRSIFNYLADAEIITANPAAKVKPLPESITKNKYFDDATFQKIKDNAEPDLLDFLMFLYHTGTRPNEARQLRYEHINRDSKLLMVPASISKNKKDDYVPLTEYVLTKYVKSEGLIFGTSTNYYTQKFNKLKKELMLPKDVNLYSIKATRAVHLARDGASPYAIMALFRHSSLEITMKYLRDLGLNVNREAADLVR